MYRDHDDPWIDWGLKLIFILFILFAVASMVCYFFTFSVIFIVIGLCFLGCAVLFKYQFKITFFDDHNK
ncbi:hypothetical protein BJI46_03495 [Acinetobacter qingfengensis]|uniref:Uncharacterized protein n=1 Tax=Acinetobacter qingfengensis TaxID=1262585 RepID=A0A1E7R564_9GAMM|nr:hypothetical protein BJI46_03495 [Acinetobacter qingfengensis]